MKIKNFIVIVVCLLDFILSMADATIDGLYNLSDGMHYLLMYILWGLRLTVLVVSCYYGVGDSKYLSKWASRTWKYYWLFAIILYFLWVWNQYEQLKAYL